MKYMYVYILECTDGTYYTGVTNDLERRLNEHTMGIDPESYTFQRRPLVLKHYEYFTDPEQAIMWEKR
jgi:putative endonuclease